MARVTEEIIDRYFKGWEHPYKRFEREVESVLPASGVLVDVGCGRTAPVLRKYANRNLRRIGLDCVDFPEEVEGIELYKRDLCETGLTSSSVDVVMARSVMEHVERPLAAYREVCRILRPNGSFVFLTANFWDYASLIAHMVPNRWHPWIVRRVEGRIEEDVFPTQYRTNTQGQVRRLARQSGLDVATFEYLGQYPSYLLFNQTLFRLGALYEKTITTFRPLNFLRGWLLVTLRKPPAVS